MIRIVVAEDHELVREGIKKIIRSSGDMCVVGEAVTIDDTLKAVSQHRPDAVTLDLCLPGHDGVEGLEQVRQCFPDVPILVLSMYPEDRFAIRALKAGAAGYITKAMAAEEVMNGIRKIVSGGRYISPRVADLLVEDICALKKAPSHESLTRRELQIVSMLGSGMQVKQIAAKLSISISSVNTYRSRIFKKTGLSSNAAVIRYAIEHQLIE